MKRHPLPLTFYRQHVKLDIKALLTWNRQGMSTNSARQLVRPPAEFRVRYFAQNKAQSRFQRDKLHDKMSGLQDAAIDLHKERHFMYPQIFLTFAFAKNKI